MAFYVTGMCDISNGMSWQGVSIKGNAAAGLLTVSPTIYTKNNNTVQYFISSVLKNNKAEWDMVVGPVE